MKKLLIKIPKEVYHDLKAYGHGFDKETDVQGSVSIQLGKDLSEMTNGEIIMTMFDCMVIEISNGKVYVEGIYFPFDEEWWNSPYQKAEEE